MSKLVKRGHALVRPLEELTGKNTYAVCVVDDQGAPDIAKIVSICDGEHIIIQLNLYLSGMKDKHLIELLPSLKKCKRLETLNLSINSITCFGAEELAKSLPECVGLASLNLDNNEISDQGARALAQMVPKCPFVRELYLWRNNMTEAGKSAISMAALQRRPEPILLSM